jgi:hypothetical protein
MEKLEYMLLTETGDKGKKRYYLTVQVIGGGASLSLREGESVSAVIYKLRKFATVLERTVEKRNTTKKNYDALIRGNLSCIPDKIK